MQHRVKICATLLHLAVVDKCGGRIVVFLIIALILTLLVHVQFVAYGAEGRRLFALEYAEHLCLVRVLLQSL